MSRINTTALVYRAGMKRGWVEIAVAVLAAAAASSCSGKDQGYKVGTERDYSPRCQFAGSYALIINLDDNAPPLRAQLEVGDPMVAFRANPDKDAKWNEEKARYWLRSRMFGELTLTLPELAVGPNDSISVIPDHVRCRMTVHFGSGSFVLDVNPATGGVLGTMRDDLRGERAMRGTRTAVVAAPSAR
jgi:hypothetical protein